MKIYYESMKQLKENSLKTMRSQTIFLFFNLHRQLLIFMPFIDLNVELPIKNSIMTTFLILWKNLL